MKSIHLTPIFCVCAALSIPDVFAQNCTTTDITISGTLPALARSAEMVEKDALEEWEKPELTISFQPGQTGDIQDVKFVFERTDLNSWQISRVKYDDGGSREQLVPVSIFGSDSIFGLGIDSEFEVFFRSKKEGFDSIMVRLADIHEVSKGWQLKVSEGNTVKTDCWRFGQLLVSAEEATKGTNRMKITSPDGEDLTDDFYSGKIGIQGVRQ